MVLLITLVQESQPNTASSSLPFILLLVLMGFAISRHPKHLRTLGYILLAMAVGSAVGAALGYALTYWGKAGDSAYQAGRMSGFIMIVFGIAASIGRLVEARKLKSQTAFEMPRT